MNSRLCSLAVLVFGCWSALAATAATGGDPGESRESLFAYINSEKDGQPLYRTWQIFPSNLDPVENKSPVDDRYQSEYFLKRLGLPVHGRWVSTYVNPTAHAFLASAISKPESAGRLEMPVGSIIVKENFRTEESFKAFNNTDTNVLRGGGPAPRPAVLTVMMKVGGDFCQSQYRYNGMDCFGGSWLWAFYGVNEIAKFFDEGIVPRNFCMNCHAPAAASDYLRSLQSQRRMPTASQTDLPRKPAQPAPPGDVCEDSFQLTSELPEDVPLDPMKVSNVQKMFDCVSWKSFVALNWPASKTERGEPDNSVTKVTDPTFMKGPRVWQTYKETYEVFQPTIPDWDPSSQAWNAPQPRPDAKGCDADLPLLSMVSKTQSQSAISVGNETGQAFAGSFGTLKDQNGHLVRYEVRFNRDEFDYILGTDSAITRNLFPAGPAKANLPDNRTGQFGGAVEVKAAWREMCTDEWEVKNGKACFPSVDDQSEYFTRDVLVYYAESDDGPAHCETRTMGLIALHIAHKTFWAPQWIWSTFSFKGNVPDANDPHAPATPFYNPARAQSGNSNCWSKPFLISPDDCPNVELNRLPRPENLPKDQPWPGSDKPNQITRLQPIAGSGLNATFNKLLEGTPFENYVLLDTQWPLNGRSSGGDVNANNCKDNTLGGNCFTMIPRYLRNPVVESYMSTYNYQRQQYSNRSCMGCHTQAGADASYIWLDAVEQVVPLKP